MVDCHTLRRNNISVPTLLKLLALNSLQVPVSISVDHQKKAVNI